MRAWLVVAICACSGGGDEPRPAPHAEIPRRSIDVTVGGAPVSIRGVEIVPSGKTLELGYRVEARDKALSVPGEIMCRVHGMNLVYPASASGKVVGPRLTGVFRPDPFDEVPAVCEVAFTLDDRRIASACYRNAELTDGACPADSFPPATSDHGLAIELSHAAFELRQDAAVLTGMFTLVAPTGGQHIVAKLSCEDSRGPITGEAALPFVPLERLPVGASVYGPIAILLDRMPAPLAACDVRLVTGRAELASYCVTTAAVRVGRCTPN